MDPLIALGSLAKDLIADKGKSKIGEALSKLIGPSSEKLMNGELSKLDIEQNVLAQITGRTREEFLQLTEHVQTAPDVERRFFEAPESQRPSPLDVANITATTLRQVGTSANHQKRALLAAALVNSFDPDLYQIGVTQEILAILELLSPPDVKTLEKAMLGLNLGSGDYINTYYLPSSIKLFELRLAYDASGRSNVSIYSSVIPTELGKQLLAHLKGHKAW